MENLMEHVAELNQLNNENDMIYRDIARSYSLSDSVFWLLYIIYNCDEPISQTELCRDWYYPKQTIHSAISSALRNKWVVMVKAEGKRNQKSIVLTEQGKRFCQRVIAAVNQIEQTAYSKLTKKQREGFLTAFRLVNQYLREAFEKSDSFKPCG